MHINQIVDTMSLKKLFNSTLAILLLILASCTAEDGLDGVKGDPGTIGETGATGINCWDINNNGVNDEEEDSNEDGEFNALDCRGVDGSNGENGSDGVDGENGVDGVGLEDMLKYGSISLELQGTRPDDVAFTNEETFRYTAVDGDDIEKYNIVTPTLMGEDIEYQFEIRRFLSTPAGNFQIANMEISLSITDTGQLPLEFNNATIEINRYAVIGTDNKYFVLNDPGFENNGAGVTDFVLSDISFDTVTNNLQFSYSFTVDAANNDSGHVLSVSGNADVFVLEQI